MIGGDMMFSLQVDDNHQGLALREAAYCLNDSEDNNYKEGGT
jgi:hypothetical protein